MNPLLTWLTCTLAASASPTVIRDVNVVDGQGAQGIHDVWWDDGVIIGFDLDSGDLPEDAQVFDGAGYTLLPGLVDTHVHISLAPGNAWYQETTAERTQRRARIPIRRARRTC